MLNILIQITLFYLVFIIIVFQIFVNNVGIRNNKRRHPCLLLSVQLCITVRLYRRIKQFYHFSLHSNFIRVKFNILMDIILNHPLN